MGRSSKAKVLKRLRASRAKLMMPEYNERCKRLSKSLILSSKGFEFRKKPKKNAFLHPEDPEAVFPQREDTVVTDFRSQKNPNSGYEHRGVMRSKTRPNNILHARMVGEPDLETQEMLTSKGNLTQGNDEELLNDLLNMEIKEGSKFNRKIKKMRKDKRKRRWKNTSCKKSKKIIRF